MSSSTDATRVAIFVTKTAAKVNLVLVAAFILARIAAPALMDISHNSIAFYLGVLCYPASLFVLGWGGFWVWLDITKFRSTKKD